jgi:hypothetical protein
MQRVADGTVLEIDVADSGKVSFAGTSGMLLLDHAASFTGAVALFGGQDRIDLAEIGFGANTTLGYSANAAGTGGTLSERRRSRRCHCSARQLHGGELCDGGRRARRNADQRGGASRKAVAATDAAQPRLTAAGPLGPAAGGSTAGQLASATSRSGLPTR